MGCLLLCVVLLSIGSVSGVFDGSSSGRLEEGPKHGARIVGGVDVSLTSAYPYQCGLFDARSRQFLCGCSLISPSWVLTAAACVRSIEGAAESDRNVSSLQAVFGTVQLAQSHRVMALARLLIHPSFVAAVSPAARVNLAWLQVAGGPVVAAFSASVRPVALADARSEPALLLPGAVAAVAGWGGAGSSGSSGALAAAGVAVRSADECSALLQSAGQLPLASFELCAGANATGPCAGDAGSALVGPTILQIGVVSRLTSSVCGAGLGVYTRVAPFRSLIQSTIDEPLYAGTAAQSLTFHILIPVLALLMFVF